MAQVDMKALAANLDNSTIKDQLRLAKQMLNSGVRSNTSPASIFHMIEQGYITPTESEQQTFTPLTLSCSEE